MSNYLKSIRMSLIIALLCMAGGIQAQTVKGNVTDNIGEPIIGATVMEQGVAANGTVTDIDGNFTLTLKGDSKQVKVTYVGMKPQVVNVAGKTTVTVQLDEEANSLNDVVVIGYGTVRKKDLTGAVSSISSDAIANMPVSSIGEAMTGKLAGVNITTTEGSPDADIKIRVRGGGSLSQDNSPLYIVDGFPVSSISDIASSEIETIDVLKDASSTAIYGARGANGVIIITTKSGKEGKTQVNFNASLGWKKLTKEIKVMDPYNYVAYQHELGTTDYGNYDDLDIWKSVAGNNWQDELFGRTGTQRQYNANVSGGTKDLKYNVGFAHNGETSIMRNSGYSKNNVNAKINANLNQWLSLDFNARLAYTKINGLSGGAETNQSNAANSIVANAIRFRSAEPLTANYDDESNNSSTLKDPLVRIKATDRMQTRFRQDYNAGLNWKPWKNITFRTEFGYGWRYEDDNNIWAADAVQNSKFGFNGQPQLDYTHTDYKNWRNANTVTYDNSKLFGGRDHINVMVGQEWSSTKKTTRENTVVAFPTSMTIDEVKANTAAGTPLPLGTTIAADENMLSFFGRVNYTMSDKYLATFTLRADGSSKFGEDHRWGVFPSLALAWRVSDEAFMKGTASWLSNLKARLSFGTAGNNRIPAGLLYPVYSMAGNGVKAPYFDEVRGAQLERESNLYNPDLKWETTITRNFGIDYGFFNGRINGTLDFYWNTTKDLLMRAEIPSNTGYSYQYQNFGQTSNKGIELALNAAIVEAKDFDLNATFNISWNKNNIDKLGNKNPWQSSNFAGSNIAKYEDYYVMEGGRLGEIWGYKTAGFYTVYDAVNNPDGELIIDGSNWKLRDGIIDNSKNFTGGKLYPGGLKYQVDEKGEPIKQRLGNTIPSVTGGFGLNARWKNLDFNIFFDYSLGNKIVNGTKLVNAYYAGSARGYNLVNDFNLNNRYTWIDPATGANLANVSATLLDQYGSAEAVMSRLNELNQNANIYNPAAVTAMYINDYAVESASFLRLNTITVGYTLPSKLTRKFFINNLRIYFTAYNLACITNYSGYDPEVDTSSKKNAMCPGIDYAAYPKSRTFSGGVNITF